MRKDTEEEKERMGKGFLWALNERMDTNEADGKHTIHFYGKYEDCEMRVKVVDGRVERMHREGDVELRGVLVKGMESGLFEEVRWYGEWYSEVGKSGRGGREMDW